MSEQVRKRLKKISCGRKRKRDGQMGNTPDEEEEEVGLRGICTRCGKIRILVGLMIKDRQPWMMDREEANK
jgi:hypothetical protein